MHILSACVDRIHYLTSSSSGFLDPPGIRPVFADQLRGPRLPSEKQERAQKAFFRHLLPSRVTRLQ